jgi:hypothetical protein
VRRQREFLSRLTDARREADSRAFADQLLGRLRARREADPEVVGDIDGLLGAPSSASGSTEPPSGRVRANLGRDTVRLPRVVPMWVCRACNTTQDGAATTCVVCGAARDAVITPPPPPGAAPPPPPGAAPPPPPGAVPPPPTGRPAAPPFGAPVPPGPPPGAVPPGPPPGAAPPGPTLHPPGPVPATTSAADAWRKLIIWSLVAVAVVVIALVLVAVSTQPGGY